jgi:broad specificity phosphatase PhoE
MNKINFVKIIIILLYIENITSAIGTDQYVRNIIEEQNDREITTIYYIVHNTTEDNEKGIVSGHYDCALSDLGRNQAKNLYEFIKLQNIDFGAIFCSSLKRSIETASIIFPNTKVMIDDRLREINYGYYTHFPKTIVDKLRYNFIDKPFPSGESYNDILKNVKNFLKDYNNLKTLTIISHQAPQLALDILHAKYSWRKAFEQDWRNQKNGWKPFWIYTLRRLPK